MAKKVKERMGLGKIIAGSFIVLLSMGVSYVLSELAFYNRTLDRFSLSVRNYDRQESEKGLKALKESYLSFSALRLQYFADKYLFKDMYKYEAATTIVNEDYEKAIDMLSGHDDDAAALNMRGVAKYRILYSAYRSDAANKDKKIKEDIVRKVLEEVRPDFESAVKKGSGSANEFNYAYNYDLTSNPESAKKALESARPGLRFILGIKVEGRGPKAPGRVKPGEKRLDDPAPGSGDTRKKG